MKTRLVRSSLLGRVRRDQLRGSRARRDGS
jgi:hypothetical protein